MTSSPIIVIGGGIAGATAAWHLSQAGKKVIVLDRDDAFDRHSSGRNAAILRTAMSDPELHSLALESFDFYKNPPAGFCDQPLFTQNGLFLAASEEDGGVFADWSSRSECIKGNQAVDFSKLQARVPQLQGLLEHIQHLPHEGVFDLSLIHQSFLQGAQKLGCELRLNCEVKSLIHDGSQIQGIELNDGTTLKSEQVVIANGAWAENLSSTSCLPINLTPKQRHLMVTEPIAGIQDWPVVWISGSEFYFRPESGGLLISACDQKTVAPDDGETADPTVLEVIAEKTERWLPEFSELGVAHLWAGMRTFAEDDKFVIGGDARVKGAYWLAGLGGHGITCAPAAGRLLADEVLGFAPNNPFSPHRLVKPIVSVN